MTQINVGVITGCNDAFIIDSHTYDKIVSRDSKSTEILKPVLRGKDIQRWQTSWPGYWLISTFPSLQIDINKYPAVRDFLFNFGKAKLEQNGKQLGGGLKARKKTNNAWFETSDTIAYHDDFQKDKILWIELSDKGRFSFDNKGIIGEASTFFLTGENLKYILAILNSKLTQWFIANTAPTSGMGTLRWKKIYVGAIPIPEIPKADQYPLIKIVDKILSAIDNDPSADVSEYEKGINQLVYDLYGLTSNEIKVIESNFS